MEDKRQILIKELSELYLMRDNFKMEKSTLYDKLLVWLIFNQEKERIESELKKIKSL